MNKIDKMFVTFIDWTLGVWGVGGGGEQQGVGLKDREDKGAVSFTQMAPS